MHIKLGKYCFGIINGFQSWVHEGVSEVLKCAAPTPKIVVYLLLGWSLSIRKFQKPSRKFPYSLSQELLSYINSKLKFLILLHFYICLNPPSHVNSKAFICQQVTSARLQEHNKH